MSNNTQSIEANGQPSRTEITPEIIAQQLGVTVEQARMGLLKSAKGIRALTDKDLKKWGKTRAEADAIAADYERRAS